MTAAKRSAQQEKERREKIVLAVLGVVLLAVVGFQAPKLLGGKGGSPAAAAPTTGTTTGAAPAVGGVLVSAAAPAPAVSQLQRFTGLSAKDPFKAQVGPPAATSGGSSSPAAVAKAKAKKAAALTVTLTPTQAVSPEPTGPMVPAALIRLNGSKRVIPLGASFPKDSPLFQLVSIGSKAIWLRLIGGSLPGGQRTLKLLRGHPLQLVNSTAGTRYVLALIRPTSAPKPAPTSTVATAPATIPATTTAATSTSPTTTTTPGLGG